LRRKAGHYEWSRVTPDEVKRIKGHELAVKQQKESQDRYYNQRTYESLQRYHEAGQLQASPDDIQKFFDGFSHLLEIAQQVRKRARASRLVIPKDVYLELRDEHGLTESDICTATIAALLRHELRELKDMGRALLLTASNAGNHGATLHIMNHAYLQSQDRPTVLRHPELDGPRQHLMEIVKEGGLNQPIMSQSYTLAGKILHKEGRHDSAIKLWEAALEGAVEYSESLKRDGKAPDRSNAHLLGPWYELANVHLNLDNIREARHAIAIGCQQDDPASHYQASLDHRKKQGGSLVATSGWLYHVTKAAASGYPVAMHELGHFYFTNTWPYLEDKVPDHVKPTPFDQFPPPSKRGTMSIAAVRTKLRTVLGYEKWIPEEPKDAMFLTAAFPSTVEGRFKFAIEWLEIAMGLEWAPSFLLAAEIHLAKEVASDFAAPKKAIRLSATRYPYPTEAAYHARVEQPPADVPMVSNPVYDPARAKELIREVFYAGEALKVRQDYLAGRSKILKGASDDFNAVRKELNNNVDKWFRLLDFFPIYMRDATGDLWDRITGRDLLETAKEICEQQKWDIYAEHDGGLLYRHGMGARPKRLR